MKNNMPRVGGQADFLRKLAFFAGGLFHPALYLLFALILHNLNIFYAQAFNIDYIE